MRVNDPFSLKPERWLHMRNVVIALIIIAVLQILLPGYARAHKVSIYAYAENGMIHSESYFVDGTGCRGCTVEVFDREGARLLEGRTDREGRFSFKIPKAAPLKLLLQAGTGHRNEYLLRVDEIKQALDNSFSETENTSLKDKKETCVSASEVEAAVERAVDRKLQPVMTELMKLRQAMERPGFTGILGGIGYIIGLLGLAMYLKYRRGQ